MELCCFGAQSLAWIEEHPGLAGYLQATGAMLALILALVLPRAQARLHLHDRRQAARTAAEGAVIAMRQVMRSVGDPYWMREELDDGMLELRLAVVQDAITPHLSADLRSPSAIDRLVHIRTAVQRYLPIFQDYKLALARSGDIEGHIESITDALPEDAERTYNYCWARLHELDRLFSRRKEQRVFTGPPPGVQAPWRD